MKARREAMRAGRDSALARLRQQPVGANPHRPATKSHMWWNFGFEQAERLLSSVMEIGS